MTYSSVLATVCALLVGLALCSSGCAAGARRLADTAVSDATIHQFGAMRSVMREGSTQARTSLRDWADPHTVAVGAIVGLDGEITVVDGRVWVSRVRDGVVVTSGPAVAPEDQATLLTAMRVARWRSVRLDAGAAGRELEDLIEQGAARQGIDTSLPFPFVIEGQAASFDMHVINGFCPHSGIEAAADREPWRLTLSEATPATIVGFFAKDSEGVLTHHGTAMHAHALLARDGGWATGHIDSISIEAGATLRVPELR